jgi:hypothetical protein
MNTDQIQITLSKKQISEIVNAYTVLSNFMDAVLPREMLYKKSFQKGLESALEEVETGKSRKVQSFDEFIK